MNFYLSKHNKQLGPYSSEQVRTFLDNGVAVGTDNVWSEGWPSWRPIRDVADLMVSGGPVVAVPGAGFLFKGPSGWTSEAMAGEAIPWLFGSPSKVTERSKFEFLGLGGKLVPWRPNINFWFLPPKLQSGMLEETVAKIRTSPPSASPNYQELSCAWFTTAEGTMAIRVMTESGHMRFKENIRMAMYFFERSDSTKFEISCTALSSTWGVLEPIFDQCVAEIKIK